MRSTSNASAGKNRIALNTKEQCDLLEGHGIEFTFCSKTGDDGKNALASEMGFSTPFKTFADVKTENPLIDAYSESLKAGKDTVPWTYTMIPSEQCKNDLGSALLEYAQGTGSWDAAENAYVDGWATEYAAANEG